MKKILSLIVCVSMILTMMLGTVAFADTTYNWNEITANTKGTITVKGLEPGATIQAYKIIEPTFANGVFTGYQFVTKVKDWIPVKYSQYKNISELAKATAENKDAFFTDLAAAIKADDAWTADKTGDDKDANNITNGIITLTEVTIGQYLLLPMSNGIVYRAETVELLPEVVNTDNGTRYVVKDVEKTITKYSRVSITKTADNHQHAVTRGLGDNVAFKIEALVPQYPVNSINQTYIIKDTLPLGLSIDITTIDDTKPIVVKGFTGASDQSGTVLNADTTEYTRVVTQKGFTLTFNNYSKIKQYANIVVTYSAVVTGDAVVGTQDNVNQADLEYAQNPYVSGTSHVGDKVYVYTFGVNVTKKDSESKTPLPGAVFKLYKVVKDTSSQTGSEISVDTKREFISNDKGQFTINQLGEGKYELQEINAPIGYVLLNEKISFTITATKDDEDNCTQWLDKKNETDPNTAFLDLSILNYKTTMPSTGGMGTVIFTVSGILLMAGAIVYLVIRKRMASVAK